jgi:adenylate kinase
MRFFRSQVLKLLDEESPKALILDGYPRTGPQAEFLVKMVENELRLANPIPVELHVSESEVVSRLAGRLVNSRTGKIYHKVLNPPKVENKCDEDGSELIQRPDDQPDVIRSRYKLYVEQRELIVTGLGVSSGESVSSSGSLLEVNGVGEPAEIFKSLEKALLGASA